MDATENLKNAAKDFNLALRLKVREKLKDFSGYKDVKIYRFILDEADKEIITAKDVNSDPFLEKAPDTELEYFWIEYKKGGKRKKFAFFFKDIDTSTHNLHVVPGIFEEFEYRTEKEPPTDRPYVCMENGKAVIKNVRDKGCLLFAEQVGGDGGWWVPTTKEVTGDWGYKSILTKAEDPDNENSVDTIKDVFQKFESFKRSEKKASAGFAKKLTKSEGTEKLNIEYMKRTAPRYKLISWYNINGNSNYSMYLTKPIYFIGCGFFTQYHCIRFGVEKREITVNCPVVDTKFKATSLSDDSFEAVKTECERFLKENPEIQNGELNDSIRVK